MRGERPPPLALPDSLSWTVPACRDTTLVVCPAPSLAGAAKATPPPVAPVAVAPAADWESRPLAAATAAAATDAVLGNPDLLVRHLLCINLSRAAIEAAGAVCRAWRDAVGEVLATLRRAAPRAMPTSAPGIVADAMAHGTIRINMAECDAICLLPGGRPCVADYQARRLRIFSPTHETHRVLDLPSPRAPGQSQPTEPWSFSEPLYGVASSGAALFAVMPHGGRSTAFSVWTRPHGQPRPGLGWGAGASLTEVPRLAPEPLTQPDVNISGMRRGHGPLVAAHGARLFVATPHAVHAIDLDLRPKGIGGRRRARAQTACFVSMDREGRRGKQHGYQRMNHRIESIATDERGQLIVVDAPFHRVQAVQARQGQVGAFELVPAWQRSGRQLFFEAAANDLPHITFFSAETGARLRILQSSPYGSSLHHNPMGLVAVGGLLYVRDYTDVRDPRAERQPCFERIYSVRVLTEDGMPLRHFSTDRTLAIAAEPAADGAPSSGAARPGRVWVATTAFSTNGFGFFFQGEPNDPSFIAAYGPEE